MNTIEGVFIEFDHIEIFDPADGETIVRWERHEWDNDLAPVQIALAIRTFYVEGAEGLKKRVRG